MTPQYPIKPNSTNLFKWWSSPIQYQTCHAGYGVHCRDCERNCACVEKSRQAINKEE
jgi:hypothetical protein